MRFVLILAVVLALVSANGLKRRGVGPFSGKGNDLTEKPVKVPSGGSLLFHVTTPVSIYTDSSLSVPQGATVPYITAAVGSNGGNSASVSGYNADSSAAKWSVPGAGWVEASGAGLSAAVVCNTTHTSSVCNLTTWDVVNGRYLWSQILTNVSAIDVGVARDGSVVSLMVVWAQPPYPTPTYYTRVYDYSAKTGAALGMWQGPEGQGGRAMVTTTNLFAIVDESTVDIIERKSGTLMWSFDFDYSTSALCFSDDGQFFGYGFQTFSFYQRKGLSFSQLWQAAAPTGSPFVGACATNGKDVAVGWYASTYNQNQVQLYNDMTGKPTWTYMYPPDTNSQYQNWPVDMAMTSDGTYFVVASWGGSNNTSPQVAVFNYATKTPVYTLNTPGSMFSADIISDARHVYAVASGKHVHANQMGEGGDLYSIQVV